MNRIIYPLLVPLFILASVPASASSLSGALFVTSPTWSDTTAELVIASSYSGRRADYRAQQRLRQNDATQNKRAEFSAFETEKKATPTHKRHQHRYGGRGHDRPRVQH